MFLKRLSSGPTRGLSERKAPIGLKREESSGLHLRTVSHSSEVPFSSPIGTWESRAPPTGRGEKGGLDSTWRLESSPSAVDRGARPSRVARPTRRGCNCNGHRGENREETAVSLHVCDPW